MFHFFQSLFGSSDKANTLHPESLVTAAIERAVDGTDARVRVLPGYAKSLRSAVIHAMDHVIALVDALPAPVAATRTERDTNPTLAALFFSAARMGEILGSDNQLRDFYQTTHSHQNPGQRPVTIACAPVIALLATERHEKCGFGYALVDGKVLNDVQQTTVSFDGHRLLEVSTTEADTRRLLKRRAFDYLLSVALAHVSEQRDEREKLAQQRALLRAKLDILHKGGSSFAGDAKHADLAGMQTRLAEIESRLDALGPVHEVLQTHLGMIATVLAEAEKHLWLEHVSLRIDQHLVLHADTDTSVPAIPFVDVCGSDGRRLTALLLAIPPDA